jgi:hypothetical protein
LARILFRLIEVSHRHSVLEIAGWLLTSLLSESNACKQPAHLNYKPSEYIYGFIKVVRINVY